MILGNLEVSFMAKAAGRIKIFMAQTNLLVGAIDANATKVISCAKEAIKQIGRAHV